MTKYLFLLFFGILSLNAQVTNVQITWNAANCNALCAQSITQNLRRIPGVANLQGNTAQGSLNFAWNSHASLNFSPINSAFALIGPSIRNFKVRVRGRLVSQGNTFMLNSIRDNTTFLLLGAQQPHPNRWTVPFNYNPANNPLSTVLFQQLSIAAQRQQTVIISGEILAPERSPPWMLIVRNVQVEVAPQSNKR